MTRLYRRSELGFALLAIAAYLFSGGLGARISARIGPAHAATALLYAALALLLLLWLRRCGLTRKYGLCRPRLPARRFLYYLPLAAAASSALWGGLRPLGELPSALPMLLVVCCAALLEELLFRGPLLRAVESAGAGTAITVSALSFGLGHIVNLFNGSAQSPLACLAQILYATLLGFVLGLLLFRSGSLLPGVLFHAAGNALSVLAEEDGGAFWAAFASPLLISGAYLLYLLLAFPRSGRDRL